MLFFKQILKILYLKESVQSTNMNVKTLLVTKFVLVTNLNLLLVQTIQNFYVMITQRFFKILELKEHFQTLGSFNLAYFLQCA